MAIEGNHVWYEWIDLYVAEDPDQAESADRTIDDEMEDQEEGEDDEAEEEGYRDGEEVDHATLLVLSPDFFAHYILTKSNVPLGIIHKIDTVVRRLPHMEAAYSAWNRSGTFKSHLCTIKLFFNR